MADLGQMISSFLSPEEGYKKAAEEQEKYYRDAQGNLMPYNQNGQSQFGRLTAQADALNNPVNLENQWAQSYSQSPYATSQMGRAKEAGLGAASSMGLLGSSAALGNIEQSAGDIAQNDRQSYMNDLMQKYMTSIGIGQNLYGTGASAAGGMSQNAMNQGTAAANTAYGEQNAPGQLFGNILGAAADAGLNYATGGMSGLAKGVLSPGQTNSINAGINQGARF